MVVRTEVCVFSENKIYPGKGSQQICRDSKLVNFSTKKSKKFYLRKNKGQAIRWTVIWRRINKKLKGADLSKKKKRKARVIIRDIQGLNREEIRRERGKTTDERTAQREHAIREIKERKAKQAAAKKIAHRSGPAAGKAATKNTRKN